MSDLDANKTALTHRITGTAMGYLTGAGFKPIETEVPVAPGWIADIASFIYPTMTEAKKMKLHKKFIGEGSTGGFWYSELHFKYGFPLTAIVEVKISISDFEKDKGHKFEAVPPAHLCYLAYPKGLLDYGKLELRRIPSGWIGLECSADGSKLLRVNPQTFGVHAQNPGDIANLIAQVAIRRHHRTEYAEMRAMIKEWRARDKEKPESRPAKAIKAVCEYLRGENTWLKDKDLAGYLKAHGIKIPGYIQGDLAFLEGLKK